MALQHLRSSTANKRPLPAAMADGQLAANTNTASPGLFFKDSAGELVKLGPVHVGTAAPNASPAAGGETGNTTGELWLDTSVTPNQLKTWNGSAWVSDFPDEIPVAKLADGAARQLLQTDAAGTGVEWTSNVDVPGTLDVTGATTLDSTLTVPLGSAAAPTVRFTGDTNTGIYSPGADQVAVATNGTGRLFVDSTGVISTEFGWTNSRFNLVNPNTVSTFDRMLGFRSNNLSNAWIGLGLDSFYIASATAAPMGGHVTLGPTLSGSATAFNLGFKVAGSTRMQIDGSGNVGIGTILPSRKLHIVPSGSNAYDAVQIGDGLYLGNTSDNNYAALFHQGGGSDLEIGSQVNITFTTGGIAGSAPERLRITSAGLVGIGTSSPATTLDVVGGYFTGGNSRTDTDTKTFGLLLPHVSSATNPVNIIGALSTTGQNLVYIGGSDSNLTGTSATTIHFYTAANATTANGTERMRITAAGLVGIGTSSPAEAKLCVNGGISIEGVYSNYKANIFTMDNNGGSSRLNSFGPNITTPGSFDFAGYSSNASVGTTRMFISSAGNVGIGTTSPNANNKVDIAGSLLLSGSDNSINLTNGTGVSDSGNGAIRIRGQSGASPNMILGVPSSGYWTFEQNGSERARIDSSGNLGIGTSSPQRLLHVNTVGDTYVRIGGNRGDAADLHIGNIEFENTFNSQGVIAEIRAITGSSGTHSSKGQLAFYTDDGSSYGERVRIDSSGRLGIGTTPDSPLHVVGTSGTGLRIGYTNNTNYFDANTQIFRSNNATTTYGQWDSSGRLLVGTSSSSGPALLQVAGNTIPGVIGGFGILDIRHNGFPANGDAVGTIRFQSETNDGAFASITAVADSVTAVNDYPGRLTFSTTADGASSPTERMRINNEGVVSISSGRLYIQKSDASNPLCYAYNTNNASTDVAYRSDLGAGSNGTSAYHFYAVTGGSAKFAIYGNGTYGTISDQRLKTHIETARNGYLDDLNRLNIVKYGWKTDGLDQATELGVIAQEVEKVFPGLIQETPPNEDGEIYKGVKTSVFTFMLIKALQEASAKIETLEAKVAALESA
jgi:hypothetical protein